MSTTAEVLRKALELLGPEGENWTKGYEIGTGRMCAGIAIDRANKGQFPCATLYRMLLPDGGGKTPIWWNDAPERTFADIERAFRRAIAEAEKEK